MKIKKIVATLLTVAMATQMMVPMAFGAEVMGELDLSAVMEDVSGAGYAFDYEADGSTLTISGDVAIDSADAGIILPANATLVVAENASLTIYAERFGIYADGDIDMVIDGDMLLFVVEEDATEEDAIDDYLYGILAAGTADADGNYNGDGNLNISATGNVDIVADVAIYSSGNMNILGGAWAITSEDAMGSNMSDITLVDGDWSIAATTAIYTGAGDVTIEESTFVANSHFAVSVESGTLSVGDGCVLTSNGVFVAADLAISENSEINAMISYVTVGDEVAERPYTVMVYGDTIYTDQVGEFAFYNDHIVFAEGATLTIVNGALFDLSASDLEGDLGSTIDTTGGTIFNDGIMIFKPGTTEEEIEAMNIQGDGAIGIMEEEEIYALPYEDVSEYNWFYDSVFFVTGFGLMEGISETEFAPTAVATEEVLLQVIYLLNEVSLVDGEEVDLVAWAEEMGISEGVDIDGEMTREEMATILYHCLGEPDLESDLTVFVDGDEVSEGAEEAMQWAVSVGLISGKPDGTLDAKGGATRAQVANILLRLVQQMMAVQ